MPNEIEELIKEAARRRNVPEDIALRMAKVESGFNPKAEGPMTKYGTAKGLFQFIDSTAKGMGLDDPYDPYKNADAAMRMLSENAAKLGGRWDLAVAAHQAGLPAVQKNMAIPQGGDVNTSTAQYVRSIMGGEQGVAQMPQSLPSKEATPQQEQPQYKMIEVKGRGTFGFPQSMKDEEILKVLREKFPPMKADEKHGFDQFPNFPEAANISDINPNYAKDETPFSKGLAWTLAAPQAALKYFGNWFKDEAIGRRNLAYKRADYKGITEGTGVPTSALFGMTGKPMPMSAGPAGIAMESLVPTEEQVARAKEELKSPVTQDLAYKVGKAIESGIDPKKFPKEVTESFWFPVVQFFGQLSAQIPMYYGARAALGTIARGTQAIGKGAEWAKKADIFLDNLAAVGGPMAFYGLSSSSESAEMFERGQMNKASERTSIEAAMAARAIGIGDVVGMVPFLGVVGKIGGKTTLQGFTGKVMDYAYKHPLFARTVSGALMAAEEMATEIPQSLAEDKLANKYFNEAVDYFDTAVKTGTVVGIGTFPMGVILNAFGIRVKNRRANQKLKETMEYAQKNGLLNQVSDKEKELAETYANVKDKFSIRPAEELAEENQLRQMEEQYNEERKKVGLPPIELQQRARPEDQYGLQEEPSPLQQPPAPPSGEGGAPLTSPPIPTGEQTQTTGMKTEVLPQAPIQREEPAVTQQIRANLANRAAKAAGVESEESLGKDYEEWLDHIDSLGEQDYAESLRGNEGQVQEGRPIGQEGKGESRQDLQQQTPEQAGDKEGKIITQEMKDLGYAFQDKETGLYSIDTKLDKDGSSYTGWRFDTGTKLPPEATAGDKARFERYRKITPEEAEILDRFHQDDLVWIGRERKYVEDTYGPATKVDLGKDPIILRGDHEGGYLVLKSKELRKGNKVTETSSPPAVKRPLSVVKKTLESAKRTVRSVIEWTPPSVEERFAQEDEARRQLDASKRVWAHMLGEASLDIKNDVIGKASARLQELQAEDTSTMSKAQLKEHKADLKATAELLSDAQNSLEWVKESSNEPLSFDWIYDSFGFEDMGFSKEALRNAVLQGKVDTNALMGALESFKRVRTQEQIEAGFEEGDLPGRQVGKPGSTELYSFGGMFGRMFHDKLRKGEVFSGKYDMMPRYYISDKGAKLTTNVAGSALLNTMQPHGALVNSGETLKLGDVIDKGWEVFHNYPDASKIKVIRKPVLFDLFGSTQGWFDHTTNTINVTPYAQDPLSTILHETQHWIQSKEGFARGGSPQSIDVKDIPDSLIMKYARELYDEFQKKLDELDIALPRLQAVSDRINNLTRDEINRYNALVYQLEYLNQDLRANRERWENGERDSLLTENKYGFGGTKYYKGISEASRSIREQLLSIIPDSYLYETVGQVKKYTDYTLRDLLQRRDTATGAMEIIENGDKDEVTALVKEKKAFELYQNIAGEIEAREVQKMAKMSDEQLKTYEPFSDTPAPEDVITLYSFSLDAMTKKRISEEKAALLKGANKDDVVNMLVSENLGFFGRHAAQGQWATKDDPAIEPVFRAGMQGKNYFHEGASQSTGTLRNYGRLDSTEKQIVDKVLWNHEGVPYANQGITEAPYIEKNGKLSLNEQFYKQYRKWASSKLNGIDSLVDAVVDIRQGMDQDMVNYWNTIQNNRKIFSSEVLDELNERRSIPNYLPHTRSGDFVVAGYIKNQDGTMTKVVDKSVDLSWIPPFMRNKYFERHLSKRVIAQLKEDPVIKGMGDITWGLENREHIPYQVMNQPKLAKALNEIVEASALNIKDPKLANIIRKVMPASILDAVRSTGMWTHMAKRRGVYGYEMENLGKILFDYKMGMYANLSKMQVSQDLAAALQKIDTRNKNSIQWADQFVTDMMEPRTVSDSVASFVKATAFMKYLGMGVKPAVVNISSAATHAHPRLAAEIGIGRAYGYLGSAMKDFTSYQMGKIKSLSPDEIKMLNELRNDGTTQAQLINEVRRSVARGTATSKYAGSFFDASTFLMRVTEENIRGGLALAAFRAARDGKVRSKRSLAKYQFEEGKAVDPNDEVKYQYLRDFTEELVNDAFSIFGKVNRPGLLRTGRVGKITSGAYTFRHFMQHTIHLASWMAKQGKLGNKDARGALFMGALSQVMLAGMAGVVGQELWRRLYREWLPEKAKIMGDDPLVWTREHLGDWAAYGLPSMLGVSVGSSYGIELPGGVEDIVGVPYSLVKDMYYGAKAAKSRDYLRAAEMIVPLKLARDVLSAHRKNTQGFTTYSGQPITEPGSQEKMTLSKPEFYRSLFGFQPIRLQRARDVSEIVDSMDSMRQKKMQDVADRYGVAYSKGDTAGMESALDEVVEWNDYWLDKGKFQYLIKPKDAIQSRLKPQRIRKGLRGTEMEIGRKMGF